MPRPANKADLLDAAEVEFVRLWESVGLVPPDLLHQPGACESWSVKDLLAHLNAWHDMALTWEKAGRAGEKPAVPAEGYTFAETPALNEALYQRARHDPWDQVVEQLRASHHQVVKVISSYENEDLFTKRKYRWTGSTSVGAYFVSASSSHYAWASRLIRMWAKQHRA